MIPTYTIGGTIVSVDASSVVVATSGIGPILQNNGGDNLFIPAIGPTPTAFTFSTPLANGAAYLVSQLSRARAPTQTCAASGVTGAGTVAGANITNVEITCSVSSAADPRFAYVTNNADDNVSAYTISGGALTTTGTAVAGDGPYSVSVDPTGQFAYVANQNSNNISVYGINTSTGALTPIDANGALIGDQASIAAGTYPISVTVHPSGKFAYVANQSTADISAYSINTTTGALSAMDADGFTTGTQATIATGTLPYAVVVDPTGQFAYVANYTSGTVSAYTIDPDSGALTTVASYVADGGPSSVAINPAGTCALVANNTSDNVISYTVNTTTGALGLVSTVASLSAPRSVAVDPDTGLFAYVANAGGAPGSVSAFSVNPSTCAIAAINAGAVGPTLTIAAGTAPISVNVDPSGAFVYVANFGSNNVSVYSIDGGGALTAVGSPATTGTGPTSVTTTQ